MADYPAADFRIGGEPSAIRSSAQGWLTFGEELTAAADQILTLDTSLFIGPEGDLYREGLTATLPRDLRIAGEAHSQVGRALTQLASAVREGQDEIAVWAVRGPHLWDDLVAAQARIGWASTTDDAHRFGLDDDPATGQTYHSDLPAATLGLSNAQYAWDQAHGAALAIKSEFKDRVSACTRAIDAAAETAPHHAPHGWNAFSSSVGHGLRRAGSAIAHETVEVASNAASLAQTLAQNPGDGVALAAGLTILIAGTGGEALGFALDATGVGTVIGVPANVASAFVITAGVGLTGAAVTDLERKAADNSNNVMHNQANGGGTTGPARHPAVTPETRDHILRGEIKPSGKASGGHASGVGHPGKSEFPSTWSDDRIITEIEDVANDPRSTRDFQGGATYIKGRRDGIDIEVIVRNGQIKTGYPTNTPRNP